MIEHVLDDAPVLDAVPTSEIRVGSLEEARRWSAYSLFVLGPRGRALERRAERAAGRPWRLLAYRRASRACQANIDRMEAILAAYEAYVNSPCESA